MIASQAIKKHLLPFTEWNNEQNYLSLEEDVGPKRVNQHSTICNHNKYFQINYSVSFAHEKNASQLPKPLETAQPSSLLNYPTCSVAFSLGMKNFVPVCNIIPKQIIQPNSPLSSIFRAVLSIVTKIILRMKKWNFPTLGKFIFKAKNSL